MEAVNNFVDPLSYSKHLLKVEVVEARVLTCSVVLRWMALDPSSDAVDIYEEASEDEGSLLDVVIECHEDMETC